MNNETQDPVAQPPAPKPLPTRSDDRRAVVVNGRLFKRLCMLAQREGRKTTNLINYILWRACEKEGLRKLLAEEALIKWCEDNDVDVAEINERYEKYRLKYGKGTGRAFGMPGKRD